MQVSQQTSKRAADSASTLDVSEQRLRSLVDYSAVAIAFTDLRGRLSHVNSSFADLLGYQADELLGRSFKDFLHPADRSRIMHLFLRIILLRRQPRMMEFRALHKEGHTLHLMSKPTRTIQSGKTLGFQAIITDITDRKKMEEELRRYSESLEESHKRLSAILDFVKAGIVIIDVETHKIVDANPAAVKMIELPREQIVGQLCHKFICPAEQGKCPITDLSQHVDNSERVLLNASGHRIPILKTVTSQVLGGHRQLIESFLDITERKQMEEEIRSLARFPEENPNPVLRLSQKGVILHANPSSEALLRDWECRVGDEAPQFWRSTANETYASQSNRTVDVELGEKVYSFFVVPVKESGYVNLYGRDITERKRSEETLRASEEFSSGLLKNSLTPTLVVNADTSIRYVNPALERMTGYSLSEVVGGKPPYPWWPKESIERATERLKDHMVGGTQYYEERWQRKNGEDFWVEINASTIKNNGAPKYYLSIWVDITERKRLEEELKRYSGHLEVLVKEKTRDLIDSEERYRRLIEESPQAIHVHCEGKFVYANSAAVRLFGAERPEQLIGRSVTDVVHTDYREIVKGRIRRINEEKVAAPYLEMKFLRLDGTEVDVAAVAIPTTYQGKPAIQVVTLDIADRKRMEKAKDNFMSAVTHELRTPLTSLKGYLELVMNESEPLPSQIKSDLGVVKRNTDRLLSLTNDLLDIQRMNSGKLQLNLEQLDLQEVIAEAATEISPLVQARKQSLNIEAPQHPLLINGDRIRLSQVLMNLLSNATKFAPEGAKIHVNVRDDDALITIEVSDPGIGIKEEDLEKVFEPFAVISKPTYIKGTGLGLSIVKGLVEAHGGKTWVESPGEGRGATFTCTLPRGAPANRIEGEVGRRHG
jgi:PAS domain S-box-containing protein